jgi:hypothetical protein
VSQEGVTAKERSEIAKLAAEKDGSNKR